MPRTKKPTPKRRPRTCLNVEVTPEHMAILKAHAEGATRQLGYAITPSDLIRGWIWSLRPQGNL